MNDPILVTKVFPISDERTAPSGEIYLRRLGGAHSTWTSDIREARLFKSHTAAKAALGQLITRDMCSEKAEVRQLILATSFDLHGGVYDGSFEEVKATMEETTS